MRLFVTLLALLSATPALAQIHKPPRSSLGSAPSSERPTLAAAPQATIIAEPVALMIAAFDSDGDARVTRAEFDAGVKHSFDSIDTRHTGSLGYIAFGDWAIRWLGDRNALPNPFEVDQDGDNKITLGELMARFDLFFTRFDADKDGVIVRSELLIVRNPAFNPDAKHKRSRE
jgi:Ca2+-binding EF-hand superfamily protein